MNLKRVFLIVILMVLVTQGSLFPLITSRVEGVVTDADTGETIEGAVVYLLKNLFHEIKKTDSNGFFGFDDLTDDWYAIVVIKDGYIRFSQYDGFIEELTGENSTLGSVGDVSEQEEKFYLKEGEIKHFKISLEKEAVLKLIMYKKFPTETRLFKEGDGFSLDIYYHADWDLELPDYKIVSGEKYGVSYIEEMCPGNYDIVIGTDGYESITYENIKLEKGKTTELVHVADFTTGQVIHGFYKRNSDNSGISGARIIIWSENAVDSDDTHTKENGEFWIGGIEPGKHILFIGHKEVQILLKPGEKLDIVIFNN